MAQMSVRRPVLLAVAVLVALAGCSTVSPSSSATVSPAPASQTPRTLSFNLNPVAGYAAYGTVEVDITSGGYTLTVGMEGLDPNSRHNIYIYDTSCSSFVVDPNGFTVKVDIVTADAIGRAVSVTPFPAMYVIPAPGRILIVDGNIGSDQALSPVACADLTN